MRNKISCPFLIWNGQLIFIWVGDYSNIRMESGYRSAQSYRNRQ